MTTQTTAAGRDITKECTLFINTISNYTFGPKNWVALPAMEIGDDYVVLLDANGDKIKVRTKNDKT